MSRRIIGSTPESFPENEVPVFLNQHIPYRLKLLQLARVVSPASGMIDSAMVEAGLIICRQLMQFLGLGITHKGGLKLVADHEYHSYKNAGHFYTDEVKVVDVGGEFVEIRDIPLNDQNILASVFNAASKATAHMTDGTGHSVNPIIFNQACMLIQQLTVASIKAYREA